MARLLSLVLAFALVANGLPPLANVLPASTSAHARMTMSAQDGDIATEIANDTTNDCCNDCTPASKKTAACVAMCMQIPAVAPVAVAAPASMITLFEETASDVVVGRILAPDPFPPRSHA